MSKKPRQTKVQNDGLDKTLNTLRTIPGAKNPFVTKY
jgi:hypothetical protein